MRVITGTARGRKLKTLESYDVRPTTDRVKEAIFSTVQFDIEGAVVLDLFSGSGQMGIEALSRGAARCYFVDNDKSAIKCITDNVHFTKMDDAATILKSDASSAMYSIHEKAVNVVFMDPPYGEGLENQIIANLTKMPWFNEYTMVVIESGLDTDYGFVDKFGLKVTRIKQYKTNQHVFIMKK